MSAATDLMFEERGEAEGQEGGGYFTASTQGGGDATSSTGGTTTTAEGRPYTINPNHMRTPEKAAEKSEERSGSDPTKDEAPQRRRSSQRKALDVADDMVLEYLAFRGFTETFRHFSLERTDDALNRGSFDARFAVEALMRPIRDLDGARLFESWEFLESKFFAHLDAELSHHADAIRCSVFRYFCVCAVIRREPRKAVNLLSMIARKDLEDARGRPPVYDAFDEPDDAEERALWALLGDDDDDEDYFGSDPAAGDPSAAPASEQSGGDADAGKSRLRPAWRRRREPRHAWEESPQVPPRRRGEFFEEPAPTDGFEAMCAYEYSRGRNGRRWREWFAMPHIAEPHKDPVFGVYFTRQWQDELLIALRNFLAAVFARAPPPKLLLLEKWHRAPAQREMRAALLDARSEQARLQTDLDSAHAARDALAKTLKALVAHCHHDSLRDARRLQRGRLFDEDPDRAARATLDAGATALDHAKRCEAPGADPANRDADLLSLCESAQAYLALLQGASSSGIGGGGGGGGVSDGGGGGGAAASPSSVM